MAETTRINGQGGTQGSGGKAGASLSPNTVLMRRYKVLGVLGGGGMGTVYKARDLNFPDVKKLAAVKEMHTTSTDRALREQTLNTFRREANILATLSHPAIPKIYDFFDQNDNAYLVMEYINGNDLEALLNRTKTLPIERILEWALEMCSVLTYLHNREPDPIVFRDIKPSNIMVDGHGRVRLIDFGIARTFVGSGKGKYTMIGTEGYSAPEQYKGNVSPKSDQYSLGATLHHILTRKDPRLEPPFSFHERPIKEINPEVPGWFVDIIDKALSFSPDERFENCDQMSEAIKTKMRIGINTNTNKLTSDIGDSPIQTIEPVWTFKTEDEIRTTPVVHDGIVYIGSYDTNIWALRLEDGELVWKFPTQGGIASSPAVDPKAGLVYFGSEDHSFNAVDLRNGRIAWSFPTQGRIRSSPVVAMDHVFFGSDDGHLYALLSNNGRKLWTFDASSEIRTRPYVTDDSVIFGTDMGEVIAVTLSGDRKWSYKARRTIASSPNVDPKEGILYIGSHDNSLYALDASSGYSSWRFRTTGPVISTPEIFQETVIFGSTDKNVYAVDTVSSREKWRFTTEGPVVSSPVVYNGRVYIGSIDSYLYCLDAKTGKEYWKFKASDKIVSTPCIANDHIIFGSLDHKVYVLPILE